MFLTESLVNKNGQHGEQQLFCAICRVNCIINVIIIR